MTVPLSPLPLLTLAVLLTGAALTAPRGAQNPRPSRPPVGANWVKMPILPPDAAKAGVSPGGEGCQWPRSGVVISPSDPSFLLLPIDVGGLYRSLDGGKTWNQASVGWNARGANCLAVDPRNPDRVIGVAGNSMDWGENWGPSPNGVYVSADRAASWKHVLALRDGKPQNAAAFDPSSFDAAKGFCTVAYVSSNTSGLFRTDDGGATWRRVSGQPVGMNPDGSTPPHLRVEPDGRVLLGGKGGLFVSADGGKTFARLHAADVWGLSLSRAASGQIWMSSPDALLHSRDDGKTWTALPAAGLDRQNDKPPRDVSVSPAQPLHLTAWVQGDNWQWKRYASRDGGKTFAEVVIEKTHAPMPQNVRQGWYTWHPTDPNVVFGLGGDWITRSADAGKTFRWANNGYNGVMVGGHFAFSAHAPETVFLAFQDYNAAFTRDGGKTWNYRDASGKGWGGHCYGGHAVDGTVMFYGDAEGWGGARRLRLSRDGGTTWNFVNGPDGKPLEWKGTDASYSDPTDARILFAGPYRSTDKGATWARMDGCEAVLTHSPATKTLYGRKGGAVVRSKDKGATWAVVAEVPGGLDDIAVDHKTDRVYAASQERLKAWEEGAWRDVETPRDQYGNVRVNTVAVDPVDPRVVYVGGPRNTYASHATVCRSTDGGATWTNLTVTAPLKPGDNGGPHEVSVVRVHPRTREAWVSGQCYGMWRIAPPAPTEKGRPAAEASAPRPLRPPDAPAAAQAAGR